MQHVNLLMWMGVSMGTDLCGEIDWGSGRVLLVCLEGDVLG